MPYYDYRCTVSGRTVEVRHGMSESPTTWGDLVKLGVDQDETPADAPVERLMSTPAPTPGSSSGPSNAGGCGSGCACH